MTQKKLKAKIEQLREESDKQSELGFEYLDAADDDEYDNRRGTYIPGREQAKANKQNR